MKAIVTGGAGFIGSHLVGKLAALGWEVEVMDLLTSQHRRDWEQETLPEDRERVTLKQVDISENHWDFKGANVVFHLAAESNVDRSLRNPTKFWQTNVMGTVNVMEKAIRHRPIVVHVSTDEVYGPRTVPAFECEEMLPTSPYAQSKAAAEFVANSAHRTYGLDVRIVRPGNAYGIGQFHDKLTPRILNATPEDPLPIYGHGRQEREWTRVEDIADALILVAERGQAGRIYNASSGESITNRKYVSLFETLLKRSVPTKTIEDPRGDDHDLSYRISSKRLRKLGWCPMEIADGLELLISDWGESLPSTSSQGHR